MTKINQKIFKIAIIGSGGIQAVVAQKLNVTRGRITQYIQKYPKMKDLLEKEREKVIDKAEHKLFEAADNGQKWAIERILRTIGKSRGYGDYQEIDHGEGLKIIIERADDENNKVETKSKAGDGSKISK